MTCISQTGELIRFEMCLLQGVLADLGLDFTDVVRVNVYMTDLDQFDRMNEVYARYFPARKLPARTCVGVARLLRGSQIEIDCIARLRR
jgi:2-iminobutanoate/2-iminopropanoate deaminase